MNFIFTFSLKKELSHYQHTKVSKFRPTNTVSSCWLFMYRYGHARKNTDINDSPWKTFSIYFYSLMQRSSCQSNVTEVRHMPHATFPAHACLFAQGSRCIKLDYFSQNNFILVHVSKEVGTILGSWIEINAVEKIEKNNVKKQERWGFRQSDLSASRSIAHPLDSNSVPLDASSSPLND